MGAGEERRADFRTTLADRSGVARWLPSVLQSLRPSARDRSPCDGGRGGAAGLPLPARPHRLSRYGVTPWGSWRDGESVESESHLPRNGIAGHSREEMARAMRHCTRGGSPVEIRRRDE